MEEPVLSIISSAARPRSGIPERIDYFSNGFDVLRSGSTATANDIRASGQQFTGFLGSPLYMSPEQINEEQLTSSTDIFSLGAVMYQMLTGAQPFKAANLSAISQKITQGEPEPVTAYRGDLPEGLGYTVQQVHNNIEDLPEFERHINGQQLCLGLRDFAIDQYGLLAPDVLAHWGIRRTDDFGRIVFAMIEAGLMSKTDEDSLDDFAGVYDFRSAFPERLELTPA